MYPFDNQASDLMAQNAQAAREEILRQLLEQSQTLPPPAFSTFEGGFGADMRQRQGPGIDPQLVANAAAALMQRLQEAATNARAMEAMQQARQLKGSFGVDPFAENAKPWERAQSLEAGDDPQAYMAAALRAKGRAEAGEPIRLVDMQGPWMGPAVAREHTPLQLTPEQLEAIQQRKQEREDRLAAARDLIAARARGTSPQEFRADVGRATPVDLALIGGGEAVPAHPDMMERAAGEAREKMMADIAIEQMKAKGAMVALMANQDTPPSPSMVQGYLHAFDQTGGFGPPSLPGEGMGSTGPLSPVLEGRRHIESTVPSMLPAYDKAISEGNADELENVARSTGMPEPLKTKIKSQIPAKVGMAERLWRGAAHEPLGLPNILAKGYWAIKGDKPRKPVGTSSPALENIAKKMVSDPQFRQQVQEYLQSHQDFARSPNGKYLAGLLQGKPVGEATEPPWIAPRRRRAF